MDRGIMKESSSPTQRRPARHFLLAAACGAVCVLLLTSSMGASPSYATEQAVGHQAAPQKVQARAFAGQARPQPQWGPNWKASQSKRGGKYVVTSVMGLDPERLNIFVKSLRRHSPDTHLVVFVEENTTHHLLEDNGAEVISFKMDENSALVLYRFELYKRYLGELLVRDSEAGVILTDSRDVLIQSDPFKEPLVQRLINEDAMLFSLEGGIAVGEVPLKAQPQNEHWIDTCFGPEMVKEMADAPISCAGITIGSVAAVHGYVTQLLATAYQDASSKCRKYGSDQAVHNYLLHYLGPRGRLTFPYLMRRNWDSPVHTAGYGWPIVIDRDGVYKRVNGSTPPIVHQYDRAFDATKIYMAMYPLREEEYRWEGPDCVKNLFLDTVNQCPPDAKAADAAAKAKQQPKAADQAAEDEEEEERQRQEQGKDAAAEVADPGDGGGDVRR